ncbi:DUF6499 domain-containing protein [uncultured Caulobacter sp.]|uniref:transcriptional regulator domain-containing protein n=1 Tax=uncultured Caulobacter sp. TaxID=158749 RepID=UPI00345DB914
MSPDAGRWRSAEAYDYLATLSAAELAWEYLRRNPEYQTEFDLASGGAPTAGVNARWGLRFPGRPVARRADRRGLVAARDRL